MRKEPGAASAPYDLKTFVGIEKAPNIDPHPGVTDDISKELEDEGCVAPK